MKRSGPCCIALLTFALSPMALSQTQITPDATLQTTVNQSGNTYTIDGGTSPGSGENLFHSFSHFDLLNGDIAEFAGSPGLVNIIGRVAGPQSTIDGILRGPVGGVNLWIINPNGVIFESNSSLDVSGSFNVSTADYLLLENGGQFFADPSLNSVLTVGNPTTFGFLDANQSCGSSANCAITIQGKSLEAATGQSLSFVAASVRIDGSTLSAVDGRINLVSKYYVANSNCGHCLLTVISRATRWQELTSGWSWSETCWHSSFRLKATSPSC